jgi:hypothetical protein
MSRLVPCFLFYLFVFLTSASSQLLLVFYFFLGYLSWFFVEAKFFEFSTEDGISFLHINERCTCVLVSIFLGKVSGSSLLVTMGGLS